MEMQPNSPPLLAVDELSVAFSSPEGVLKAVRDVSFSLERGKTLAIVGESGCGKSLTALALMGLADAPAASVGGTIHYEGRALDRMSGEELRSFRGGTASMVFQEPMTSLNPVMTIGGQLFEAVDPFGNTPRDALRAEALKLLAEVRVPDPASRLNVYPHQLSGGLRQRVMIAMAIARKPKLLIADEPTTALDVTVQAQVMELLNGLVDRFSMSMILITHDLSLVASNTEELMVMYAGYCVEKGPVREVYKKPRHPYTEGLLKAVVRKGGERRFHTIPGRVPGPADVGPGCPFEERCHKAVEECSKAVPELRLVGENHQARCIRARSVQNQGA